MKLSSLSPLKQVQGDKVEKRGPQKWTDDEHKLFLSAVAQHGTFRF